MAKTIKFKLIFISFFLLIAAVPINAQNDEFPILTGPYLGQKTPGLKPEIFAPGIISKPDSRDLMHGFFDRGKLFILYRYPIDFKEDWTKQPLILMKQVKGKWMKPYESRLTGKPWFYNLESISENDKIVFAWTRNLDGSGPSRELYLWSCIKTKEGWTEPVRFKAPINTGFESWPSLSKDRTIYFFSQRPGGMGGFDIYFSRSEMGEYKEVQNLGCAVNTEYTEEDPFISPDESFLLFDSDRPGGYGGYDLYITWKGKEGVWTKPANLGATINSKYAESRAYVSPDGKYLFFTSNRNGSMDTWWVDAKIFKKLK